MPRLSIIIPHRDNSLRMEETLISVLENRPNNCEILVAHDGSYRDQYDLANEVVFVQAEPGSGLVRLINEATFASCAPVVSLTMDGVCVSNRWAESALHHFENEEVGAVVPETQLQNASNSKFHGIHAGCMTGKQYNRSGDLNRVSTKTRYIGPSLAYGFYRRKALLALGGWCERLDYQVADIDMAFALAELGFSSVVEPDSQARAADEAINSKLTMQSHRQIATILLAYQQIDNGWRSTAYQGLHQVVRGGFLPKSWIDALAWCRGMQDNVTAANLISRIEMARRELQMRNKPVDDIPLLGRSRIAVGLNAANVAPARRAA